MISVSVLEQLKRIAGGDNLCFVIVRWNRVPRSSAVSTTIAKLGSTRGWKTLCWECRCGVKEGWMRREKNEIRVIQCVEGGVYAEGHRDVGGRRGILLQNEDNGSAADGRHTKQVWR
eukprot:scaffold23989_cov165-Skeletonema_marinoi.AAC.1